MLRKFIYAIVFSAIFIHYNATAQTKYGYGSVIGGQNRTEDGVTGKSYLDENQEGVRVIVIQSRGSGAGGIRAGGAGGSAGVSIYDVPKDTDYLELLIFYANMNPRTIRKDKIKILRVASTGISPYLSKDIQRYWTSYNFKEQYLRGGPFDLVRPYDIIIVEQRGIFNREIFDPLTDITFLLTLPTLVFSIISVYNTFFK